MLTSRPEVAGSHDVRDDIATSNARINIIDNTVVDPPLFSIVLDLGHYKNSQQISLLLKNADQPVSLFDIIKILNTLGFHVEYEEIR